MLGETSLTFTFGDHTFSSRFLVAEGTHHHVIIGKDFMLSQGWSCVPDAGRSSYQVHLGDGTQVPLETIIQAQCRCPCGKQNDKDVPLQIVESLGTEFTICQARPTAPSHLNRRKRQNWYRQNKRHRRPHTSSPGGVQENRCTPAPVSSSSSSSSSPASTPPAAAAGNKGAKKTNHQKKGKSNTHFPRGRRNNRLFGARGTKWKQNQKFQRWLWRQRAEGWVRTTLRCAKTSP